MQWPQENIPIKMIITKNTKTIILQDNQYTPDYNYNYEPMKQQQQQSSYDYNNEYGYDNT